MFRKPTPKLALSLLVTNYPPDKYKAAAQAQYFSRERRIVLSGNVYVLQKIVFGLNGFI